jgi:hypothetical protein
MVTYVKMVQPAVMLHPVGTIIEHYAVQSVRSRVRDGVRYRLLL